MSDAWDIASLLLKILAVASAITGVALPVLDAVDIRLVTLSRGQLIAVTLAFVATAVVLGAVDYTIGKRPAMPKPAASAQEAPDGPSINLEGGSSITSSFNKIEHFEQHIGSVTIAPGDPPEERARKKQQAVRMIAEEVISAIQALDDRLGFIDTTLAADPFAAQLKAVNEEIAPAASQTWGSGYRVLIAQQRAASLRGAFNSRPLHTELREPLLRQMEEVGIDPSAARSFYDALTAVADKSEDLLALVADPVSSDDTTINGRHLAIQRDTVQAASSWAYLTGLRLLDSIGVGTEPWLTARLASLRQLEPQRLPDPAELRELMSRAVHQATDAVHAKAALLEEARPLPQGSRMKDCDPLRGPARKTPRLAKPRFDRPASNGSKRIIVLK